MLIKNPGPRSGQLETETNSRGSLVIGNTKQGPKATRHMSQAANQNKHRKEKLEVSWSDRLTQTDSDFSKGVESEVQDKQQIERIKHRFRRKGKACLSSFRTRATPHVSKVLDHFPSVFSHEQPATMGLSKSTRICILLAIDTIFFLIELITGMSGYRPDRATTDILTKHPGYAVHSLALVADSFHMVSRLLFSGLQLSQNLHQWSA